MAETKKYRINRVLEDGVQVVHPETDATQVLFGTKSTVQAELTEVRSLAEGRARSVSYLTKAAMELALSEAAEGDFKVGDNIFIVATDVPDYWVSQVYTSKQTTNASQGIYGFYKVSILETQKVDLSPYQQHTPGGLNTDAETIVGAINELDSGVTTARTTANTAKSTADSALGKANTNATNIGNLQTADGQNVKLTGEQQIDGKKVFKQEIMIKSGNGLVIGSNSDEFVTLNNGEGAEGTFCFPVNGSGTLATISDIPTKVSDLTNDSGFTTNKGTVTSVTIKAGTGISVDSTSAITTSGTRTISLPDSGVTAGDYSVLTVNQKGIVTAGQHLIEWGEANQKVPSDNLAAGGLFFELIN